MIHTKTLLCKQSKLDPSLIPLFKDIRRSIKHALRTAEAEYFEQELFKSKNNPRKMWKILNKSTGFRKPNVTNCSVDSAQKANEFNSYFSKISAEVHSDLKDKVDTFRLTELENKSTIAPPAFKLRMSTARDVEKIIKLMDTTKATGHDNIGAFYLCSGACVLSPIISKLINHSIDSGTFPDEHKVAKITPLYKKGVKTDPGNHRPVSVLPSISKISERFIADRIVEHVEENHLINVHQSGFRRNHGTHLALHHMVDSWAAAVSQGKCAAVLAIDLSKAFDCLNHDAIFNSLERIGIEDCKVLKDYLTNRKQYVSCNGFESQFAEIMNGVPQGSILGPLIFILTICDIENVIKAYLHLFADDITTWVIGTKWTEMRLPLEETARELFTYLAFKGLCINFAKCHLMLIGKQYLDTIPSTTIRIFHQDVHKEEDIKLLGLIIDNKLSFEKYIKWTSSKM